MRTSLFTSIKGVAMGIAEVIPGVSGGTIAFITGIYEKLIDTIKSFGPGLLTDFREGGFQKVWTTINGNFLTALLLGMALGVGVGVFVVVHLLENFPELLWSFFFGLIIASAIYIGREVKNWDISRIFLLVTGITIAYYITIAAPAEGSESLVMVFISGAIAISALMLPGISGSFMLLLMGMYTYIIPTLKTSIKTLDPESLMVVGVFALGCAVGLFSFSRLLSLLLHKYHQSTMAMLTGFMIGSLNKIWPWRIPVSGLTEEGTFINWQPGISLDKIISESNVLPSAYAEVMGNPYTIPAIFLIIIGFLLVFAMDFLSKKWS